MVARFGIERGSLGEELDNPKDEKLSIRLTDHIWYSCQTRCFQRFMDVIVGKINFPVAAA